MKKRVVDMHCDTISALLQMRRKETQSSAEASGPAREGEEALPDASYLPLLAEELTKAGFTGRQIDKIFSENVLRVYREILG